MIENTELRAELKAAAETKRISVLVRKYAADEKDRLTSIRTEIKGLEFQFPLTVEAVTESIDFQVRLGSRLLDDIQPSFHFSPASSETAPIPNAEPGNVQETNNSAHESETEAVK